MYISCWKIQYLRYIKDTTMTLKKTVLVWTGIIGLTSLISCSGNQNTKTTFENSGASMLEATQMKKPNTGGGIISQDSARLFAAEFRYSNVVNIPLSWSFGKEKLINLLNDPNVQEMRFYAAVNPTTGYMTLLAVGVDENNNDIMGNVQDSRIMEYAKHCPTLCANVNNVLMLPGESGVLHQFIRTAKSDSTRKLINYPRNSQ